MLTIDEFKRGIMQFIDEVIAPKANSLMKFVIYFFVPAIPRMIDEYAQMLIEIDDDHDLITTDGHINLDNVYKRAKGALEKAGSVAIPKLNYIIDMDDLEHLYKILLNMR